MKKILEPLSIIYPLLVVLVTSSDKQGSNNIITIAWTTNLCRKPVCLGIAIGKGKYSENLIRDTMEFVVNIPGKKFLREIDICGSSHGDIINKFAVTKFTAVDSSIVKPKMLKECPINIECKVVGISRLDSSNFFIWEVLKVHIEEDILKDEREIDFIKLDPVLYAQEKYYSFGSFLEVRGFSKKSN